jgi:hypothetical protein
VHITFRMAVRDMLPEAINQAAQNVSRPLNAEEHRNIRLKMATQLTTPPDPDEELFVLDTADPVRIESIRTGPDGRVDVQLEAFDTDQIANEEAVAVEQLLAAGWEIDLD